MPRSKNPFNKAEQEVVKELTSRAVNDEYEWFQALSHTLHKCVRAEAQDFYGTVDDNLVTDIILQAASMKPHVSLYLKVVGKDDEAYKRLDDNLRGHRIRRLVNSVEPAHSEPEWLEALEDFEHVMAADSEESGS